MDFSVDDSWDSTPAQDKFIQDYFKTKQNHNGTVNRIAKKRKKHPTLSLDMTSNNSISKKNAETTKLKHSMVKVKQSSNNEKVILSRTQSENCSEIQNLTESNVYTNPIGIDSRKKSTNESCYQLEVPNKNKRANKRSLKLANANDDLSEVKCLDIKKTNSNKSSFNENSMPSKKKNLKRNIPHISQVSPMKNKSSVMEVNDNIKRAKITKLVLCSKEPSSNSDESSEEDIKANNKVKTNDKSTLKLKELCSSPDESANSDDDEDIRNELQDTPMFKKIQKLMRLAPHLNPNFNNNTEAGDDSWEEISDEDSSSEDDENSTDDEVSKTDPKSNDDNVSESDEDSSSNKAELLKEDSEGLSEDSSENEEEDSPKKQSSKQDQSNTATKKLNKTVQDSSLTGDKLKNSKSQNQQTSTSTMSNLLLHREPASFRANENSKRCSTMMNKARAKLASAKFRLLNEKLYTESGEEAFKYFKENREEFEDYHLGYEMQVAKWPLNPVDVIIQDLQKGKNNVVIADLGCGDAKIARTLNNKKVHSFDLVSTHECVTACNISRVPLPDYSVDVAVFCLSLMGVNLVDYLREAYRILKLGGSLKIAEVESRIENLDLFIASLKSLGFDLERKNTKHKLFVFLDLIKVKKGKSSKAPAISLRPCWYKKR